MDTEQARGLLAKLLNATRTGKFVWEETADENTFRLLLDAGIVHVSRTMDRLSNGQFVENYGLSFLNQNNTVVEKFRPSPASKGLVDPTPKQLRELYEAARDSALKPKEFFQRLEQEVIRRSG